VGVTALPRIDASSPRRIVTVYLPGFGLQAHVRHAPELKQQPLALEGDPPRGRIVEVSRHASEQGVAPGQSIAQARVECADLVVARVDEAALSAARLEIVEALLPILARLEWAGGGIFHAEGQGLMRLHGGEAALLARCVQAMQARGFHARAASASTRFASLIAARTRSGIALIPEGSERAFLAGLPLSLAPLPEGILARLDLLGVRTLGSLGALPADGLADRFGREVARVQRLVRGEELEPLTPLADPQAPHAARELDEPVSGVEPVMFLLKSCCDDLAEELEARGMAAARIELRIARDCPPGGHDTRVIEPARPLAVARDILSLCRLEIETRPLRTPLMGLAIAAVELTPQRGMGGELFGRSLCLEGLSVALDRVRMILGPDAVVTPSPRASHRREARVAWTRFEPSCATTSKGSAASTGSDPISLERQAINILNVHEWGQTPRLLVRPIPAHVSLPEEGPGHLLMPAATGLGLGFPESVVLVAASGPMRVCGEWWDGGADVDRDEYLLHGKDGGIYLAARDRRTRRWQVMGWLD
jgi:protein ImuB